MTEKKSARRTPSKTSKKRLAQPPAKDAPSKDVAAPPAPEVSEPEPKVDPYEGVLYTTGIWKGMPNYECVFCAYATVDHQSALEHAADAHAPEPSEEQIINTGLVDGTGAPITRAVQPRED